MDEFKAFFLSGAYKYFLKPILFLFDPEFVHEKFLSIGHFLGDYEWSRLITKFLFHFEDSSLEQEILGIKFKNPVGLSAGFDKDANLMQVLPYVGFGFEEIGTVTLHPYQGNSRPRLTRLPKSHALVVNYGLKNEGVDKIIGKIKKNAKHSFPLGISIGKTNSPDTASDKSGVKDYFLCAERIKKSNVGDFYVINISCPNTFGGEPFTTPEKLETLLKKIATLRFKKPIFVKMPINLPWSKFSKLLDIAVKYKISGVIIGNLNKDHKDITIKEELPENTKGGISGVPTKRISNMLISKTYKKYKNKLIIVGVGGIFSGHDAYEKIKRGASLVELITGMIYEGPQLIGQINQDLSRLLFEDGYKNISEAIGAYHK